MGFGHDFRNHLRSRLWRRSVADEVDRELDFHVEMRTRDYTARGLPPDQARDAALRRLGDRDRLQESCRREAERRNRTMRRAQWLSDLRQDLALALRGLARRPAFTLTAVATLALGLGATVAVFSVVESVLLQPLPYAEADRLVRLVSVAEGHGVLEQVSAVDAAEWAERSPSIAGVALFRRWEPTLHGDTPRLLSGATVSPRYFELLGVPLHAGGSFSDGPDRGPEVVLGYGLWQRLFAGDPAAVGSRITLSDTPYTVVGVAARDFEDPISEREIWRAVPVSPEPAWQSRGTRIFYALGRLAAGASLANARAELEVAAAALAAEHPETNRRIAADLQPVAELLLAPVRPALMMLLAAAALVLLIACINVAGLLLARAAGRRSELDVRTALGAGRWRLLRQLLTESTLLAVVGGAGGVALAWWGTATLLSLGGFDLPREISPRPDRSVLLLGIGLSLLTGVACGLAPALAALRRGRRPALGSRSRGPSGEPGRRRLGGALVVGEVALTLVLLAASMLLIRSLQNLRSVDTGLRPEGVLTLRLDPSAERHPDGEPVGALYRRVVDAVAALPGVAAVGITNSLPVNDENWNNSYSRDDRPPPEPGEGLAAQAVTATPGLFPALGIGTVRGRPLTAADREDGPPVVVISAAMARRHFPEGDAVGKRITMNGLSSEIVGVVEDVAQLGLADGAVPIIYRPHAQEPASWMRRRQFLVVRTATDPMSLLPELRTAVLEVDPAIPLSAVRTMRDVLAADVAAPRFRGALLTLFALLATGLAIVGIAGVTATTVSRRLYEIGIRIALGASRGSVFRSILGRTLRLTLAGVALGIAVSLAVNHLLAGMLFGVGARDPASLLTAALLLTVAATAAGALPARRALGVDPNTTLRAE